MNITMSHTASNKGSSLFAANLPARKRPALKSAQEKAERQLKTARQIEFWENQKENLKKMECATFEDIAKKLEIFHSYEDEIAAAKTAYNQEQMRHVMDEAKEIGEKIAEEAEKLEPKTAEERQEEMAEEAVGSDEEKGVLDEIMENISSGDISSEDILHEELSRPAEEPSKETAEAQLQEEIPQKNTENTISLSDAEDALTKEPFPSRPISYKRIDLLI